MIGDVFFQEAKKQFENLFFSYNYADPYGFRFDIRTYMWCLQIYTYIYESLGSHNI